jgi:hypothetical protein
VRVFGIVGVRLGHERGPRPERPVREEFRAAEFEPLVAEARRDSVFVERGDRTVRGHHGDTQRQKAAPLKTLVRADLVNRVDQGADGRDSGFQRDLGRPQNGGFHLGRRCPRHAFPKRLDVPFGVKTRFGVARASLGLREKRDRRRVRDSGMSADSHDQNRARRADAIEIFACREAVLAQLALVEAPAQDPLERRLIAVCGQGSQQFVDGLDIGEIDGAGKAQAEHDKVQVGIAEARNDRPAVEIHLLGFGTGEGESIGVCADKRDSTVAKRQSVPASWPGACVRRFPL